ncbi:solute carrier family 25 member 45-like isoform X1 [Penaeus chinensis]|uniref:solute carrier family 25 member 45-like isoform X1 n=2 Tax=Penaeus chinensis TaxID=139456 RepID=UPI001FB80B68|nr:solute carrier family 25 member 45-like isoform X1 [Penaeus chinensis]XP_047490534.1 solute carrier family 25 member 45-like isoform X1 [Penaeus chinensis]
MNNDYWCDFVAGWIGGCAGLVAGHPLDTIKVRQQTMGNISAAKGILNTFKFEGVRGFYKGMGFPLLSTGTLNALFFGVYGNTVRILSEGRDRPSFTDIFLAGCAGGVAQLVVACPVDLIKIKMQMQTGSSEGIWGKHFESHYRGPTSCLLDLYRKGGIRACYTGLNSMAIRDIPSFGMYMILYEGFIRTLCGSEQSASPSSLVFCGGMAGVISWAMIIPLDVVKSRIQGDNPSNPQYKNARDCFVKSYKAEGLKVFTRGFCMMSLRAFPTNGAIFLGYVSSLNLLKRISGEQKESETVVVAA